MKFSKKSGIDLFGFGEVRSGSCNTTIAITIIIMPKMPILKYLFDRLGDYADGFFVLRAGGEIP